MSPPTEAAACPTEDELEVALTLGELAVLILQSDHHRPPHALPDSLRWGSRKPRSLAAHLHHPLIPSPHPPPPLDDRERDGRGVVAAVMSSPTTPLSFPGSGGEDNDVRPKPTAEHHRKLYRKCVEQHQETMVSLSDSKSNLEKVDEYNYTAILRSVSANSSALQQLHQQREVLVLGGGIVPVDPTALFPGAHGQWLGAPVGRVSLPDLNARPDEAEEGEDLVWGWEQHPHMAYKAATSALARRRRLQIQREKRSSAAFLHK